MKFSELEKSTQIILKVILAGVILIFLWAVRDIALILLLSLILASAMDPMVEYFNQKGKIPRAVSVLSVYLLVFGVAGLVIALFVPAVTTQLKILTDNLPQYLARAESTLHLSSLGLGNAQELVKDLVGNLNSPNIISGTFGVFNGFLSFITVLVISFYLVAEERGMKKFIAALIPDSHQEPVMALVEKIQKKMGLWVLGQLILSFSIFSLTLIGLVIIGLISGGAQNPILSNALLLALIAGLMEVVPYIGPFVSAVPAVFIAFIVSPSLALVVAIMYLLIQKFEGYVLVPKIMEKTVGTSPLAVLVALLVGFKLAGVIGLLISVPLVSAITVVINEFWAGKGSSQTSV